jgi:hypothetical protein
MQNVLRHDLFAAGRLLSALVVMPEALAWSDCGGLRLRHKRVIGKPRVTCAAQATLHMHYIAQHRSSITLSNLSQSVSANNIHHVWLRLLLDAPQRALPTRWRYVPAHGPAGTHVLQS